MRFVTIMGLTLIAKAINESIFNDGALLFAAISILALIVDIIDTIKKWSK